MPLADKLAVRQADLPTDFHVEASPLGSLATTIPRKKSDRPNSMSVTRIVID